MSNGIKFDAQGRMIVAEGADYGGRRVTRTDMCTGRSEIIAAMYEGRRFNSPNDITIDLKGRIYFSDPRYVGHEPIEQPLMGVYRVDPPDHHGRGQAQRCGGFTRPKDPLRRVQRKRGMGIRPVAKGHTAAQGPHGFAGLRSE